MLGVRRYVFNLVWREVFEGTITSCPSSSVLSRNKNQHLHTCVFLTGQGNFGKVLKARAVGILPDRPDLNVVAVKVVKGDQPQSSAVDELWAELQLMKSLKPHPNIVNLLGQCTCPGMLYVRICSVYESSLVCRHVYELTVVCACV